MREFLRDWLVERYDPSRANAVGDAFYSEVRKTWIRQGDVKLPEEVLPILAEGRDSPVDKDGVVKMFAVASQARTWLGYAFGSLIADLPQDGDDDAPEAAREAAAEEIKRQLTALLKHMIHGDGPECGPWGNRKRALGTWAHWTATLGRGARCRFGSLDMMSWLDAENKLVIAMLPSLARQVWPPHREIADISPAKFAKRCAAAGIRAAADDNRFSEGGDRSRWTVLSPGFIEDLDLATDHADPTAAALNRTVGEFQSSEGKGVLRREAQTELISRVIEVLRWGNKGSKAHTAPRSRSSAGL